MKASWDKSYLKRITHWVLLVLIIIYILSGLGIVYSPIVESLTLGLLTKALSFKIHFYLLIPFILALLAHIIIVLRRK